MPYTEFTVRSGGSNLNAGSLDGSAEAATAPLVTYASGNWVAGTGVFTVASGDPVAAGVAVGHWASVYPNGSSVAVFVGRITARDTTTITVSLTAKSGTAPTDGTGNRTLVVGGAWAGGSGATSFPIGFISDTATNAAGNPMRCNFKNDQTYTVSSTWTQSTTGLTFWRGYTTAFGDSGRANVRGPAAGAAIKVWSFNNHHKIANFDFGTNGTTGGSDSTPLLENVQANSSVTNCVFHDCRGSAMSAPGMVRDCEFYATGGAGSTVSCVSAVAGTFKNCIFRGHLGNHVYSHVLNVGSTNARVINCIFDSNTGSNGVQSNGSASLISGCSFRNCRNGITNTSATESGYVENSIFVGNSEYGISGAWQVQSCAFKSNTSGPTKGPTDEAGSITLTVDPFVDPANGDYRLNGAAGGGALLRGTGHGTFVQTQSGQAGAVSYPDIGAIESRVGTIISSGF